MPYLPAIWLHVPCLPLHGPCGHGYFNCIFLSKPKAATVIDLFASSLQLSPPRKEMDLRQMNPKAHCIIGRSLKSLQREQLKNATDSPSEVDGVVPPCICSSKPTNRYALSRTACRKSRSSGTTS